MIKNRINFINQDYLVKYIIYVNAGMFIISLLISGRGVSLSLNPFTALAPSTNSLIFLGAAGTIPINQFHEWWSLIAANWLHGSLMHIVFNMIALIETAPLVIREYGMHRMFIIYTLSGIFGFYLSYLAGVMVTIGASAAICGLIGAALFFGKSRGGMFGRAVFRQTSTWVIFIFLFGLAIPDINNYGHGGGLAAGIFLGWLLGYNEKKKEKLLHMVLSFSCMILTAAILIWTVVSAFSLHSAAL